MEHNSDAGARAEGTEAEPVYLRALELADLDTIYAWHNDPRLYETLVGTHRYVSRATVEEWLLKRQAVSNQEINLAICVTSTSLHVGNLYIREIDWVSRHGELHIFIGDRNQRARGYGGAALALAIKYAFEGLGLRRLYLFVLEDNEPAINLYRKSGFVVEGLLRKHAFKEGRARNVVVMGLCAEDVEQGDS